MRVSLRWPYGRFLPAALLLAACASSDRATAPIRKPEFAISDALHEGGTLGFYFLPPMVAQPTFSGTFDADISTLNPAIAICDVTSGPDESCGGTGGTPAVVVFTTTSTPAIAVDLTTPQYQVNWNTQAAGFVVGHTYRVHVTAGASGTRRELGFADALLTTAPGQAKNAETGDLIVLQDARTLPIHFRIERGIPGALAVSAATPGVPAGGTDLITATVEDLHGAPLAGATVAWSVTTTPTTGVADPTRPLAPTSGQTGPAGTTATTFKAGATPGTAAVTAASGGLAGKVTVSVACNCWTTKTSMPTARAGMGLAAINGLLYAVGGDHGNGGLATLEVYDPSTDTWTTKASMPTARTGLGVAAVNGILYAVGGSPTAPTLAPSTTVEAYDPASNTWTSKAPIPTGLLLGGVVAVNGTLYAVGGGRTLTSGFAATVEAYDPASDTWTTKASMPTARLGLDVVELNGLLYAVGGSNGTGVLATLEVYDPSTDTWTTKASMPTARPATGVAATNGLFYAVGGFNSTGVLATLEVYDPSTNTWTTKGSMPTARLGPRVAVINGLLYAASGFRFGLNISGEWLATLEAYQP